MSQTDTPICVPLSSISLKIDAGVLPDGCGIDYSLGEQWTGRHWLDGRKIYQKTIDFGQMPANSVKVSPLNITGFKNLIKATGYSHRDSDNRHVSLPQRATSILVKDDEIHVHSEEIWNGFNETFITLQYTCTDR